MLFEILAFISVIITITLLRRMVNVFPSLIACMLRWKESVNLEASVKQSYDRNILAVGMVLPFVLIVERFGLYRLSFMEGMSEPLHIALIFSIFILYIIMRRLASVMVQTRKSRGKAYVTAEKAAYTFFIILTVSLVLTGGILSFFHMDPEVIRNTMLWISASIYAVFLFRKLQIFVSAFSILTSFLYLCALEIVPTGLLIAPALIF